MRISSGLALVALGMLLPAGAAAESSGAITVAEASSDWTTGHFAGWANWTGCGWEGTGESPPWPESPWEEPSTSMVPCEWKPFVTVGPGSTATDCEDSNRSPWSEDEAVSVIWQGGWSWYGGKQSFDFAEASLSGGTAQLACLGFVETIYNTCLWEKGKICPQWYSATSVGLLDAATVVGPGEESEESSEESEEGAEPEESEPEAGEDSDEESEPQPHEEEGPSVGESVTEESTGGPPAVAPPPPRSSHSGKKHHRRCAKGKHRAARKGRACRHRHQHQRRHHKRHARR